MRVLVCGDRNWTDYEEIARTLLELRASTSGWPAGSRWTIIHGAARGADTLAGFVADSFDFDVESYPADWEQYGRAAGPIRNKQMLEQGKPLLVLAFHDDLAHSKGTKDMVERARKAGIPVRVISHDRT